MKKIFKIVVSLTLLFIISCEKEEINNQNQKSFDLEKSKLTLQQVLKEINNEKKNDLILSSLNKDKNHLSNNFIARTTADSSNYIFNKYEKNNYVTYSLNLSTYTTETPYFLNLIITNNNFEALKIGYIKYIPENPISNIDLKTFSGEIQILNTDFEVKASSIFNNGIRQEDNQTNSQQRLICIDYIQIIEVTCSHGGGHGVGESCGPGYTNDAHYEIIQQTRCNELNDGPEPEFIIDINPIGNNGAGGGGSAVDASINLAINIFKSTLNPAQLAVYNSNKTDFDKYLKNNSISLPDALGAYTTNINTEAEQFVLEMINASLQLELNIAENWFNDYENFRNQMSNSERAIFDSILPNRQMWYMGTAYKAKIEAEALFPSSLHNGKGDAYRHALWNGLCSLFIGTTLTEQLTSAHETKPSLYTYNYKENIMDLHNNHQGRIVSGFSNLFNIYDNILNHLQNGSLRYINNLNPINNYATINSEIIPTNQ